MRLGIIARQSVTNAIYTYTGIGLGALLTLVLYPTILDPDQYGLTRVLISAAMIGSQFSHLGMRNTVIRFFPLVKQNRRYRDGFLFFALIVPLGGFLLFIGLYMLFREPLIGFYLEQSPLLVDFALYILPITLFLLYFEILNSYLRSLKDSTTGSLVSDVILRLLVMASLGLYAIGWIDFHLFITVFNLAYGSLPLLLLFRLLRLNQFNPIPDFSFLKATLSKAMASYGLYTMLGGFTTVLVWNIDILMLGSLSGLEQTGVYAIAFYIGTVITVPKVAIERITTPLIAEHLRAKRLDQVDEIYKRTSSAQLLLGSLLLLIVWANAAPLLNLLPDVYAGGLYVVLIIGFGKLFDMATGCNGSIILTSRHYRFDLYANLLLVFFTISTNLILIPLYGIEGAAMATALSILLYNCLKYVYVWYKWRMQPFGTNHLWILLPIGLSLLAISWLPELNLIANLILSLFLLSFTFLLPAWLLDLTEELRTALKQIKNRS